MTMDGSQPLIRLENVSKVFVTDEVETHALSAVHFDVQKGEYLSIAGPSGCGDSTLLAILGLSAATRGGGARTERRPADPARGRADREPGFGQWRGRDEPVARVAPGRIDHLHGHARSAVRGVRRPDHPPLRRTNRRREHRVGEVVATNNKLSAFSGQLVRHTSRHTARVRIYLYTI